MDNSTEPGLVCWFLTPNSSCSTPSDKEMRELSKICSASRLQGYILFSSALVLGLPGSVLTGITAARLPLKPSTLYIRILAASDFLSLIFASLTYYAILDDFIRELESWEEFTKWFGRIFQSFSHWLLVLICLERYVSVRFPLQKARLYTMQMTCLSCLAAFIISSVHFILSSFLYFEAVEATHIKPAIVFLYLTIYIFVPMTLIVLLTSLTAFELKQSQERRRNFMTSVHTSLATKTEVDVTRMMFLTVICFVIFTLPMLLFHIYDRIDAYWLQLEICPVHGVVLELVFYTSASLSFLNHAVNFYLYVFGAPGFRRQFLLFICCRPKMYMKENERTVSTVS